MTTTSPRDEIDRVAIAPAIIDDAALLARMAATCFAQTFGDANRPEDLTAYLAEAFSEERQRDELSDARNRIWLARAAHDRVVGYAHVRLDSVPRSVAPPGERPAELARLYADRAWHGRHVGGALMRTCIASAREHGADWLWLGVWEQNSRAIAFYQKHGFRTIGEQTFVLGTDRQRDLVMSLDLTTNL